MELPCPERVYCSEGSGPIEMNANDHAVKALGRALRVQLGTTGSLPPQMQAALLRISLIGMLQAAAANQGRGNRLSGGGVCEPDHRSRPMDSLEHDHDHEPAKPAESQDPPKLEDLPLPVPHRTSA
jgi:hypothetical protein